MKYYIDFLPSRNSWCVLKDSKPAMTSEVVETGLKTSDEARLMKRLLEEQSNNE